MGNNHSSEAPRKASHKLSKPCTNQQRASTIGLPSPNDPQRSDAVHYTNSYHIGRPISGMPPSPSSHVREYAYTGLSNAPSEGARSSVYKSKERERRLSGIIRSNTYSQDHASRHSMVAASIHSVEQQSRTRANSMVYGAASRSLIGDYAISLPNQSRRGSIHHDLPIPEPRLPMFPDLTIPQVPPLPTGQISPESMEGPDVVPRSPHTQQAGSITRNNSEVSLYPPVRRRSVIQKPGVATRSPVPLTTKSSFRRSLPPSPSVSRRNSIDTNTRRPNSMLPSPRDFEFEGRERVVTPCEDEYKQLGGIKFGSLRIVNGSPGLSAVSDRAQEQYGFPTQKSPSIETAGHQKAEKTSQPSIVQPKPTSSVTSPVIATFDHVSWGSKKPSLAVKTSGNDMIHNPSATSITCSPSMIISPNSFMDIASKRTEYEDGLFEPEAAVPEILNVREVPLARANGAFDKPRDAHKQAETVARSDSGFASTSSSTASGKPLSKTDSGYGSNLSLRSLRRSDSKSRNANKHTSSTGAHKYRHENTETGHPDSIGMPDQSLTSTNNDDPSRHSSGSMATSSLSKSINFSSNALGLSILRSSKSRDASSTPKSNSSSRSPRPNSGGGVQVPEVSVSTASARDGTSKQARLQRFWNSTRRKSLPAQYVSHDVHDPLPVSLANPNVQHDGQDLLYPAMSTLRLEPSKSTLKTIFSVSSIEFGQAQDTVLHSREQETVPVRHSIPRRELAHEVATSAPTVTIAEKARSPSEHGRKTMAKSYRDDVVDPSKTQPLKSRSSPLSFLEMDPSLPTSALYDHPSRKGSKTPPPLSMRRQSMRSNTTMPQAEHQNAASRGSPMNASNGWQNAGIKRFRTHSPIDELDQSTYKSYPYSAVELIYGRSSESSNQHDLQDYRHTHSASRRGSTGQQFSHDSGSSGTQTFVHNGRTVHVPSRPRQSWGHATSRPKTAGSSYRKEGYTHQFAVEVPPRQLSRVASNPPIPIPNQRETMDPRRHGYGSTPPYRILHSYDSPAYRNAPIWS